MADSPTSYPDRIRRVNSNLGKLRKDVPEVMKGFADLHTASTKEATLDRKTKELIALGISITSLCDDCIAFHTQGALKAGASREEITEAIGVAVFMGGGPGAMYATHALEALEEFQD
ncbi:MAG: carboxymuconolactone decarboxylase family protein [Gammaproteobacteria bacterium]|nr:carboxymuconolactone decarboxylase family protein [Gammaproteobacteria bacterium]NIR83537.1 carboxymuconolactone decarboxylase family protein [Gammaproteobacteria bacterium]NIR91459.1 carboxymuconolactone decarboxylase family protein [Gammaproteobacteria bacterium]NIU04699.1 carboxymuconolactone decarboxylase family protein [Gammaproteobacteria bacterium]NIV51741.1 carboxymuconolactone decarboxylase family protein [Gammaproteobacteria bacterium]